METSQLEEVKALGGLGYSPEQVAQIMGIAQFDMQQAVKDEDSEIGNAYWSGWYTTDMQVRKSIFDLAKRGSSPAQAEVRRIMADAETRRYYEQ